MSAASQQLLDRIQGPIVITAYASLETAIEATRRGAWDFLPKPFTLAQLGRAVREALGPDFTLMHDPVQTYTYSEAVRVGRALEELDYFTSELKLLGVYPADPRRH